MQTLSQRAAFERLLRVRPCAASPHFALHHLPASLGFGLDKAPEAEKLSTCGGSASDQTVDKFPSPQWFACVVPKRHARRAVTRSLLKRVFRESARQALPQLQDGIWLLRLRAPLAQPGRVSAASGVLRQAVRSELSRLWSLQGAGTSPVARELHPRAAR
jgi:ribonuclease P protein component